MYFLTVEYAVVSKDSTSSIERYEGAALDGDKSICLDALYKDIANQNCLIYSFECQSIYFDIVYSYATPYVVVWRINVKKYKITKTCP